MSSEQQIPERPKDDAAAAAGAAGAGGDGDGDGSGAAAPSKGALKKAAKEKEKAEKAAKRAEEERARKAAAEANDVSKDRYGELADGLNATPVLKLTALNSTHVNSEVSVQAYVQNARVQSAKLAFLELREGVDSIQGVISESTEPPISRLMVKFCGTLSKESIVRVTAKVAEPKEPVHSATISGLELHITGCFVVAQGPLQLEMQIKDAMVPPPTGDAADSEGQVDAAGTPMVSLKTRLDNRVLDLRVPVNQAIFEINAAVGALFREHMAKNSFREIWTPKIVGAATEGGAGVFEVKYFQTKAYLSQSPQFFKQMAISGGMERVFEIGPVFRAENSNTPRHLTEFTGLDFEMTIYNRWDEIVDQAEDLMLYIFRNLRQRCAKAMDIVQKAYPEAGNFLIPEGKSPRIRFADGIKMLKEAGLEASEDEDISTTNEKKLGQLVREKFHSDFFILTHFPIAARPFYTHLDPMNPKVTLSYDAFIRGQEIASGAQRVHKPEMLIERMKSMDPPLNPQDEGFRHYVDAFRKACPPHGGGGFGLNRITMLWLGLPNIRQSTMFPRDPQRVAP